jgi:hypothetical protein
MKEPNWRSASRSIPTNTARAALSSSQSIRSSAGAALWVAPELADPLGQLEVGQHEDVEKFGAWTRTECVQAFP